MTINQLHELTGNLIQKGLGYKRMGVCIDKESYRSNLENDGVRIFVVDFAEIRNYPIVDPDGGIAVNKDGTEKTKTSLILFGENGQKDKW